MNALASYRALLRNGPLARLLVGEFASGIGNWLYLVALMVIIYKSSGPALLGVIGAARILPYVVFSIPAGMIADRFDRRYVLMTSDIVRGLLMLVLAWIAAVNGPAWAMVVVAVLATCFATLFYPAIGALIPSMVRDETEFGPANSAWQTLDMLAFVVGPALGGLLIAGSDLTAAFLLNAVSFGVIAVVLWTLPSGRARPAAETARVVPGSSAAPPVADTPPVADVAPVAGGPLVPEQPRPASLRRLPPRPIAGIFAIDFVSSFVSQSVFVLTVLLATQVYRNGDAAVGVLNAAIGVGGVVGAVAAGVLVLRRSLAPAILLGAGGFGAAVLLLGFTHVIVVGFVLISVAAAASVGIDVADTTVFQRVVPDELRGRGTGAWMSVTTLFNCAGALTAPILFESVGLAPLMVGMGVALALGGVAAVTLIGPAAVREPTEFERELLRAARLPVFAGLPPARLDHALRHVKAVRFHAGDVIIRQGDSADRFYVLAEGHVTVTGQEAPAFPARLLRRLGPDDVFGEIGLLTNAPRTATVTADDDVLVLAMNGAEFVKLVTAGPGVASRFLDLYRAPAEGEAGGPAPAEAPAAA